ncbi:hypothetical protein RB614_24925 [Phytohabitans sp. ZYX-F-186]|uniref:Glycerophosphoryl diester phosphodiesterase membrane domain-containing protein n=1 Tax=Phytohabitans maris TaxID=3071409 RepID=A0ABU0ZL57_9ACTN|nr:hypothetical protein [Phytohabitans sp. ZYX-F-186]MDQ7907770.1 hypothetical protein [Phytohabitans sp. ZYX-F-186]
MLLPLRPLTVGELLDAAVSLLRAHGRALLPVAAVLAAIEQALLAPLRLAAGAEPPAYLPDFPQLRQLELYWVLLATGAAAEVTIIALLGGLTARAAGADLLGQRPTARQLLRPSGGRLGAVAVVAAVAGATMFVAALAGPAWFVVYALFGLAAPAVVLDRLGPGRALRRSATLACRAGLRAAGIRVLGYVAWLAIRVALGLGAYAALDALSLGGAEWTAPMSALAWLLVNTVAYPTLACLDAVLHLETRMRTEGLDILLARAGHRGPLTPALLGVAR